jgi:hypothetical protein
VASDIIHEGGKLLPLAAPPLVTNISPLESKPKPVGFPVEELPNVIVAVAAVAIGIDELLVVEFVDVDI